MLQGIISNDIHKASHGNAIYALILTPQGKYLFDFFVIGHGEGFLIDCDKQQLHDLFKKLSMYKLRSEVALSDVSNTWHVLANLTEKPAVDGVAFADPRTAKMGFRIITKDPSSAGDDPENYEKARIENGVAATHKELISEDIFPLQNRMEELHAIDFNKGCYVGQEVTARSKHRGEMRKNLFVVEADAALSEGAEITNDGKKIGALRSVAGNKGIALLEVEAASSHSLQAGSIPLRAHPPAFD